MAFKKVQSGNPGGRPKGSKTVDLISMLKEKGVRDHHDEAHYVAEFLDILIDNYKEDARPLQRMGITYSAEPFNPSGEPLQIKITGFTFMTNGGTQTDSPANA